MKADVLRTLVDKTDILEKMTEEDRKDVYMGLDDLVNECSNTLFELH